MSKLKVTKQRYTYHGVACTPIEETLRRVPGGRAVDIRIHDPRSTITYATVNVDNIIDRQGRPYRIP